MAVTGLGSCTVEIHAAGAWRAAARFACEDIGKGTRSPSTLSYDFDYLDWLANEGALGAHGLRALSCRYPATYAEHAESTWPAFLLDVIPSGAARAYWERELGAPNTEGSDWVVLKRGAGNPIGNLRIREAADEAPRSKRHPGFEREDVVTRAEGFLEYARANGAPIAGGSGAGGDAPKFLLREDSNGKWHADGAIDDAATKECWIVKFPRSHRAADRTVLEAEAGYYRVAAELGARVRGPLAWDRDCLFVPRFDRPREKRRVARLGVESLYSLAGVTEWGASTPKETLAAALARFATDPPTELRELLLRDVLDVALGNTDNHGRNTAVLKHEDGTVELAPLFDFAPMVLDPSGIARVCRWRDEDEGFPIWSKVVDALAPHGVDPRATKRWLRDLATSVRDLPKTMKRARVPKQVIDTVDRRIERAARSLEATRA